MTTSEGKNADKNKSLLRSGQNLRHKIGSLFCALSQETASYGF